jgi:hypothetical protein
MQARHGRAAERVDRSTGVRDRVAFVPGGAGEGVFVASHLPAAGARAGVLLCSSLFLDLLRKYRLEVALGRGLAASGIAAGRFHYRGTGHSDGAALDMTWTGMLEDAEVARHEVVGAGGARIGFVGTRFGALVAAAAAARVPEAPLVLVEPVRAARRFFQEGFRADRVAGLRADGDAAPAPMAAVLEELAGGGAAQVLGHELGHRLFTSARDVELAGVLGDSPRPVLVVQLGEPEAAKAPIAELIDGLVRKGFDVDLEIVDDGVGWWFEADEDLPDDRITGPIVRWLGSHLGDVSERADAAGVA